jgi:hypothetical protein
MEQAQVRELALMERLNQAAANYPLPFILLNALPKSGSTFLMESLRLGLQAPYKEISNGYFPQDLIDHRKIKEASACYGIVRTHLDANATNIKLLKKYSPRLVLQLRDPRQALLSWVHHVKWYLQHNSDQLFASITPFPPDSARTDSLSAVIDWHLINYLPNILEWTEEWLIHIESGEAPVVLLTHFKDFRENPDHIIARILQFYEIPTWAYLQQDVPKSMDTHFRKGELEEWREVFNHTQQQICADLMADYPRVNRLYGGEIPVVRKKPEMHGAPAHQAGRNGHQPHASESRR